MYVCILYSGKIWRALNLDILKLANFNFGDLILDKNKWRNGYDISLSARCKAGQRVNCIECDQLVTSYSHGDLRVVSEAITFFP